MELTNLDLRYLNHAALALPGGGELYYEDRGDGPPVVLLNNFYLVSPVWRNFTDELERDFRLVSYDLRNQGASYPGSKPVEFVDHVEDVRRLLDHLEIEKTYIVSTSISTLIAREFALAHPERVAGIVLVGPAFSPNGSLRRKLITRSWLASLEAGGTEALFNQIYPLVFADHVVNGGGTATYLALRENFLALVSATSIRENLKASLEIKDDPADLGRIAAPTLIIVGDGEFMWSDTLLQAALDRIPDAQAVILPHAGHVPFFDDPAGFQAAVHAFIGGLEAVNPIAQEAA